jgi:hypothetical protein
VQPEPVGQLMPEAQLAPVGHSKLVGLSIEVIKGRQLAPGQVVPLGHAELVIQPL